MPTYCTNCGNKIVKYPIKDKDGNIIWLNLFKMDLFSIIFLIAVLSLVFGYNIDTAKCDDAINDPCKFCNTTGCCQLAVGKPTDFILEDLQIIEVYGDRDE